MDRTERQEQFRKDHHMGEYATDSKDSKSSNHSRQLYYSDAGVGGDEEIKDESKVVSPGGSSVRGLGLPKKNIPADLKLKMRSGMLNGVEARRSKEQVPALVKEEMRGRFLNMVGGGSSGEDAKKPSEVVEATLKHQIDRSVVIVAE